MNYHCNELPENLISNLILDTKNGMLLIRNHDDSTTTTTCMNATAGDSTSTKYNNNNNNSNNINLNIDIDSIRLFSGCKNLLQLLNSKSSSSSSSSTSSTSSTSIEDLDYVGNIHDTVLKSINELGRMRDCKVAKARSDRYAAAAANNNNNQNQNLIDDNDDDQTTLTPSQLSQMTFNTFNILIPILHTMIHHPQRLDYNLDMKKGPRIRKKQHNSTINDRNRRRVKIPENIMDVDNMKDITDDDEEEEKDANDNSNNNGNTKSTKTKKSQCYLFFENVYSITTIRAFELLKREVKRLLHGFPSDIDPLMNPHYLTLYGYSSSEDIMKKTFCFDRKTHNDTDDNDNEDNEDDENKDNKCTVESIESFAHKVDIQLIHPLSKHVHQTTMKNREKILKLRNELANTLNTRYRKLKLDIYGSCLSGLSLGSKSSDVDLSLSLPLIQRLKEDYMIGRMAEDEYNRRMKKYVWIVRDTIVGDRSGNGTYYDVSAVPYARVPVVKGSWKDNKQGVEQSHLHFDICFLNDIAVANSTLLKEYSDIDDRVKMLMICVKSWAKWKGVSNAAENTLSSYSWMILVIFYLQCIDFVPVLNCPNFMADHDESHDDNIHRHNVNNLRTHFLTAEQVKKGQRWKVPDRFSTTPVSLLLGGFFNFYARVFPKHSIAVSIRLGKCILQKSVFRSARLWRMCIEDPFETHDSHCPHDLGTPLSEEGQTRVTKALEDASSEMGAMFTKCTDVIDCIGIGHQKASEVGNNKETKARKDKKQTQNINSNQRHNRRSRKRNHKNEHQNQQGEEIRQRHDGPVYNKGQSTRDRRNRRTKEIDNGSNRTKENTRANPTKQGNHDPNATQKSMKDDVAQKHTSRNHKGNGQAKHKSKSEVRNQEMQKKVVANQKPIRVKDDVEQKHTTGNHKGNDQANHKSKNEVSAEEMQKKGAAQRNNNRRRRRRPDNKPSKETN